MVFLRLTVKVLPWELGAGGKPFSFMIPLHDPEDLTLGELASMIQKTWKKLRPGAGPLDIKEILHEPYPDVNLDMYDTVADVFVQYGRATADGQQDQRATVLVIQTSSTTSEEKSRERPPENPQSSAGEHEISSDELGTSPTPKTVPHASGWEGIDAEGSTTVASGEPGASVVRNVELPQAGIGALDKTDGWLVQKQKRTGSDGLLSENLAHTIGTKAPGDLFAREVISIDSDSSASNSAMARRPLPTTNSKASPGSTSDKCPTDTVRGPTSVSSAGRYGKSSSGPAASTSGVISQMRIVKPSGNTRNSPIEVESDETSDESLASNSPSRRSSNSSRHPRMATKP